MEPRIILTKADFSANNIGRYVELSELTKKVLAKQTQYSVDSPEVAALNIFLQNLSDDGFIGGSNPILKTLIIPALAANHDELLYNIAYLDANGYPTDEMNEIEKSSEHKVFTVIRANEYSPIIGLRHSYDASTVSTQATIDSHLFKNLAIDTPYPDFSVINYGQGGLTTTQASAFVLSNENVNYMIRLNKFEATLFYTSAGGIKIASELSNFTNSGFVGFIYKAKTKIEGFVGNNDMPASSISGSVGTVDSWVIKNGSNIFSLGNHYADINSQSTHSLIALGDGMTIEQLNTLRGYIETLMTALHASV